MTRQWQRERLGQISQTDEECLRMRRPAAVSVWEQRTLPWTASSPEATHWLSAFLGNNHPQECRARPPVVAGALPRCFQASSPLSCSTGRRTRFQKNTPDTATLWTSSLCHVLPLAKYHGVYEVCEARTHLPTSSRPPEPEPERQRRGICNSKLCIFLLSTT